MKKLNLVKYPGGKGFPSINSWIISNLPKNYEEMVYIEPYAGAGSVLLNKNPSQQEILSDIDISIINIFKKIRDEPKEFIKKLSHLKYCQETFDKALNNWYEEAINEYILRRMSRGGLKKVFSWSDRQRGGKPGDVNAWQSAILNLSDISERLKEVYIFNKPALDVIRIFNSPNTLLYLDPPYLHDTRNTKDLYEYEMTIEDHVELSRSLNEFKGKVALSGYSSQLYSRLYKDWNCSKKKIANHLSQTKTKEKKTECLWCNY